MSVGTPGLASYRNDSERTRKYTKQTRNAARTQVVKQGAAPEVQRQQLAALNLANVREEIRPVTTPAGWYPDPGDAGFIRWFDGGQWTAHVQQSRPPAPPQY
ncbi:DUF2510 domain-containing protein [Rhodococcus fascians]|nr:DUF2510 domain-containing protein [Rhodococcus fascians]MBY3999292.1 DUF2510 domain-containing protein [Rhodococcus fascians]MBY4003799.1 DUF2510 domain-containing protein [Rhodococcus fascians]MBY4009777.1 DUF2510 domain-containing protein [Rhodococcus fascians]MBY4018542.1 DUF2510 domain-containing protein [Rhodococcus fascians]